MTVVALRRAATLPACPAADPRVRAEINNALSFADDPAAFLPEGAEKLTDFLSHHIEEAEGQLAPVGAAEVLKCLAAFAADRHVAMPEDDLALDLSVEIMGQWPRDLFREAVKSVWTSWPSHFRRLPDANALLEPIKDELDRRRKRAGDLRHLALRLDGERRREMERRTEEMRAYSRRSDRYSLEKLAAAQRTP
jgi:hypothetical protein